MAYGSRVGVEALRTVAFGSVTASYVAVGSATAESIRLVAFNNATNQSLLISLDGSTDHFRVVGNGFKLLDLTANKTNDEGLFIAKETKFYLKHEGTAPTSGNFWIEAIYAAGGG
jgi:hypothetical protein